MKETAINDATELKQWFFEVNKLNTHRRKDELLKGIFINGAVRKELLISIDQGKITISGRVLKIKFENMTGGVYRAYLEV